MPFFLKHGGHGQSGLPWSEAARTLRQSVHVCARAHACAMSGVCVRVWVHVCTRMHPRVHDLHLCARVVACGACACVLCAHASLSPKPNFTKEKAALIIIPPPPTPPVNKITRPSVRRGPTTYYLLLTTFYLLHTAYDLQRCKRPFE